MATDEREFGGDGPVAVDGVKVGVADVGVFDVDEKFIWTGFGTDGLSSDEGVLGLILDRVMYLGSACSRLGRQSSR